MNRAVLAAVVLAASRAAAMPVDRVLELKSGDPHFEKARFVLGAEVQPPDLATVEILPAGELMVMPLRAGEGLLLIYKQGQVEAARLRIDRPGSVESSGLLHLADARLACGAAEQHEVDGETFLLATVDNELCRAALKKALASDLLPADHLRLTFTVAGLQAQLRALNARLKEAAIEGVTLGYAGATLTLKGHADAATHQKVLGLLWSEALGRLDLDDLLTLNKPEDKHAP